MTKVIIQIGGNLAELNDSGEWESANDDLELRLGRYGMLSKDFIPFWIYHPDPAIRLAYWVLAVFGGKIIDYPDQELPEGAIG